MTGKEWNDGHIGQATNPAACYDGWHGMFDRKPSTTNVEIHHDLGVDVNYVAYQAGKPLKMGPPGSEGKSNVAGGPYRPAEFDRQGPPPGGDGRTEKDDRSAHDPRRVLAWLSWH